jgi:hypothetical protein
MPAGSFVIRNEEEKLRIRLSRSYTGHFWILVKLIKISTKLKEAKVIDAKLE